MNGDVVERVFVALSDPKRSWPGILLAEPLRVLPGDAHEVSACGLGCAGLGADRKSSCEDHLRWLNATDPVCPRNADWLSLSFEKLDLFCAAAGPYAPNYG
jgi:hypothetical protein